MIATEPLDRSDIGRVLWSSDRPPLSRTVTNGHGPPEDDDLGDGLPDPICWPTFWAQDHTAANWHVEPFLARGRAHAVYAPAKAGKSLFVLDVVAAVATGAATLHRAAQTPEDVVYLDYEMTESDLQERLEDMGYDETVNLDHLHYYQLPTLPPLDTRLGGETLARIVERDQAGIVVVDTTGRAVKGDENDADTIRDYYRHTGMALKQAGVTAVRVDHAGKNLDLGQRGSSAKADDVDVVWQLTAAQDGIVMKATHRRLAWIPETVAYERREDPLIHVPAAKLWHARTKEIADLLDGLDVPVTASVRQARAVLKAAGQKADSNPLQDALKFRRDPGGLL